MGNSTEILAFANLFGEFAFQASQTAFNLLLQSTALILIGLLAARLLKHHGSAVQSAIYRATLVAVLICPAGTLLLRGVGVDAWMIDLPPIGQVVQVSDADSPSELLSDSKATMATEVGQPFERLQNSSGVAEPGEAIRISDDLRSNPWARENEFAIKGAKESETGIGQTDSNQVPVVDIAEPESKSSIAGWVYSTIVIAWLAGGLFLLVRLLVAYLQLSRLRGQSVTANEKDAGICQMLADQINVQSPKVLRNPVLSSPCLSGIVRPAILLPTEIEQTYLLEKAFAHELAHLRRRDNVWNLIQRVGVALFFFQPLMWRLVYRLETTAEEVCDDVVLEQSLDRKEYAQQLVALAESNLVVPNMAGIGMFNGRSILSHRVVRILDSTRRLTTRVSKPTIAGISGLSLALAILSGLVGNGVSGSNDENSLEVVESIQEPQVRMVKISGNVTDHAGNPVEGAEVTATVLRSQQYGAENLPPYSKVRTSSDGTYSMVFAESKLLTSRNAQHENIKIMVTAPGHGIEWISGDKLHDRRDHDAKSHTVLNSVDLKLAKETFEPKLRLIDSEGSPVVGAKVKIHSMFKFPNDDLEPFYERASNGKSTREVLGDDSEYLFGTRFPAFVTDEKEWQRFAVSVTVGWSTQKFMVRLGSSKSVLRLPNARRSGLTPVACHQLKWSSMGTIPRLRANRLNQSLDGW